MIESSNTPSVSHSHGTDRDDGVGTALAFLADGDGAAMSAIVEEAFLAYLDAVATGDALADGLLREALPILGRRPARDLGPTLAGVAIK